MNKYKLICKKGEGTFSEVLKVQAIKNGKYYAIKRMKNHFDSIEQVNNLREIQALRRLSPHPNVIKLQEVIYDRQSGKLALVFELMDMNIYELIRGRRTYVPEEKVRNYMYQLLKSLDHMHRNGIFHRDIKPENILIIEDRLKLADFGSCRGIYSKQPFTEYISTRWYRAPECLLTDGYYNYKMDLWGAGCVFFEVLSLYPLFPGSNELDQIQKIHDIIGTPSAEVLARIRRHSSAHMNFNFQAKDGTGITRLLPHVSEGVVDLISRMLTYNPEERLSARQALRHPYFRDLREAEKRAAQLAAQQQATQQQQQQPAGTSQSLATSMTSQQLSPSQSQSQLSASVTGATATTRSTGGGASSLGVASGPSMASLGSGPSARQSYASGMRSMAASNTNPSDVVSVNSSPSIGAGVPSPLVQVGGATHQHQHHQPSQQQQQQQQHQHQQQQQQQQQQAQSQAQGAGGNTSGPTSNSLPFGISVRAAGAHHHHLSPNVAQSLPALSQGATGGVRQSHSKSPERGAGGALPSVYAGGVLAQHGGVGAGAGGGVGSGSGGGAVAAAGAVSQSGSLGGQQRRRAQPQAPQQLQPQLQQQQQQQPSGDQMMGVSGAGAAHRYRASVDVSSSSPQIAAIGKHGASPSRLAAGVGAGGNVASSTGASGSLGLAAVAGGRVPQLGGRAGGARGVVGGGGGGGAGRRDT